MNWTLSGRVNTRQKRMWKTQKARRMMNWGVCGYGGNGIKPEALRLLPGILDDYAKQ